MLGKTVLYLPGFDHAGIATQTVVERRLAKDKGLTRHDLGRPKFLELVWEWKEKYLTPETPPHTLHLLQIASDCFRYHAAIKQQLKRLGGSLDWSREAFSMDTPRSHAVEET